MKIVVKETVAHYHVVDIGEDYTIGEFEEDLCKFPMKGGIESIKDLIAELEHYGIEAKVTENGAGQETTMIEVVDEYDE